MEEFEGDTQFSRSRLIDEDVSTQQDLKTIKVNESADPKIDWRTSNLGSCRCFSPEMTYLLSYFPMCRQTSLCRKRSNVCNFNAKENNGASKKPKVPSSEANDTASKKTSSFLSREGSLSVALMASRRTLGRKRKTTFLSGSQKSNSFSRSQSSSSSSSKIASLNHVVFMAGESQGGPSSQLPDTSNSFMGTSKSRRVPSKKANLGGGSLWNKVCSKNFHAG